MKKSRILLPILAGIFALQLGGAPAFAAETHNWKAEKWMWSSNYKQASVTLVCKNHPNEEKTLQAQVTERPIGIATCTTSGKTQYTASVANPDNPKSKFVDWKTVTVPATGHNWTPAGWTWSSDNSSAAVNLICKNNKNHKKTLEAQVTSVELSPATCTDEGETMVTAKAENPDKTGSYFVTFKKVYTPIDPNGHAYDADENEWNWNKDHTKATLTKTCLLCGEKQTYDADVTEKTLKEPTSEKAGQKEFTATAVLDAADPENTTVTDVVTEEIPALGHDWKDPVWTWSGDHKTAEVKLTCGNDPSHTVTVSTNVTSEEKDGKTTFTATAEKDGKTFTDQKTVEASKNPEKPVNPEKPGNTGNNGTNTGKTASADKTASNSKNPNTGDAEDIALWAALAAGAMGSFLAVKKRKAADR